MISDRRKSLSTRRHELGFQLTIDWCVVLIIGFLLLLTQCSTLENNIQRIKKRSDESSHTAYKNTNGNIQLSPQIKQNDEYSSEIYETSTIQEKLSTFKNDLNAWKIINLAIENAQKTTSSKDFLEDPGGIESSTEQFIINDNRNFGSPKQSDSEIEITTLQDELTTLEQSVVQNMLLENEFLGSVSELTTISEEFSTLNFFTEPTTNLNNYEVSNSTDEETIIFEKILSTVKSDLDSSESLAFKIASNLNESDRDAILLNNSRFIEWMKRIDDKNDTQIHQENKNMNYPFNISSFELVTISYEVGILQKNGYLENETVNKNTELQKSNVSINIKDKTENKEFMAENNFNRNVSIENTTKREVVINAFNRSKKDSTNIQYNKGIINKISNHDERNDSNENKIDDTLESIANHNKKSLLSLEQDKLHKCFNCSFQRRMTNISDEMKSIETLNKSSNITKVKNITRIESRRIESSTSPKTTTEDDYNISYEIEDSEEDIEMVKNKINTTEEPLSFGPLNNLRDFASGLFESLYERVIPKGLRDIVTRLQEQNEKLETYNLRSKEENGGLGQLGRSIIKGLSGPLNQVMQGVRDYGSLDSDRNFLAGVASGVVSFADGITDSFRDRVKAIYPGTLWCGDGHMARSAEVGLFFLTDSCCQKHDSCKYSISAGETKYGLTNTGIFTRSHCECDKAFYRCLKKTNSLISSQIGLTYFSILGPQCFKRDFPIIKCLRRTRVTGQKCEEYLLDYSQPKIWQWFDNETF